MMDTQFINDAAEYILTNIRSGAPITWSWGVRNFKAIVYKEMAALEFIVSGFVHKGKVIVAYNGGADTFEVYYLDASGEVVNSRNDVYFDQLIGVIDSMVGKSGPESDYRDQVSKWLTENTLQQEYMEG